MLAQNIAPKPAALPPAAQPSLPASSAGGPSFAQFLTHQTSPPAPPPQSEPEPGPSDDNAKSDSAAATHRAAAQTARSAAQNRAGETPAKPDTKAAAATKADAPADGDAVASAADDEDAPATPELKEFTQLIGMNVAVPDAAAAAAKPDSRRGRTSADAADDDAPQGRSGLHAVTADNGRDADAPKAAARPADLRADKSADRSAARAAAEPLQTTTRQVSSDPATAAATPAAPNFASVLAQAALPTAASGAAPAATYAHVQAPLHGAAFAPELGARVSLMAVDGVQHAELQLNPADMGPVTVQIVVDGSQAQVSFHALQSETRQALEQSLPDLAAALQGQGLTLSGGGVFQQAPRDADHAADGTDAGGTTRGSRGGNDRIGASAGAPAAPARRTVGLLDTFA